MTLEGLLLVIATLDIVLFLAVMCVVWAIHSSCEK